MKPSTLITSLFISVCLALTPLAFAKTNGGQKRPHQQKKNIALKVDSTSIAEQNLLRQHHQ